MTNEGLLGICLVALLCSWAWPVAAAEDWPLEMTNDRLRVVVQKDLSFWVHSLEGAPAWRTRNATDGDWQVSGKPVAIGEARKRSRRRFHDGMHEGFLLTFGDFAVDGLPPDASIAVFLGLAQDEPELAVTVFPGDSAASLTRATYPYPLSPGNKAPATAVLPWRPGVLIPDDWPVASRVEELVWSNPWFMPFFASISSGSACLAITETPHDTTLYYDHQAAKPTVVGFRSDPSMGALSYPRRFLLRFLKDADYVAIAKEYRRYARSVGRLVTLEEKARGLPKIRDLVKTFQFEAMAYEPSEEDVRPASVVRDFDARLADTDEILNRVEGPINYYSSSWKFIIPNGAQIGPPGGWDKLKRFVEGLHERGCLVQTYDNHHLMTTDSPYYTPDISIKRPDGKEHAWEESWGGNAPKKPIRPLAPALAPAFVRLKYENLLARGIRFDAVYQDQFAAVRLYEDYDPLHRGDRRACQAHWAEALDVTTRLGMITGTEVPYDWSVPHAVFYAWIWDPGDVGIRVPLWHLVYHDCALVRTPDQPRERGLLRSYLCGYYERMCAGHGKPIDWSADETWVRLIKRHSEFVAQVAMTEMTRHAFLDDARKVERTEFANGIAVEADFKDLKVRVTGAQGFDGEWRSLAEMKVP
ncbi:MAG: hypothetical protein V2A58_11255 [Planctomycetota bacterium]